MDNKLLLQSKHFVYVRQELWKSKRRRVQSYWLTWRKYREIFKDTSIGDS